MVRQGISCAGATVSALLLCRYKVSYNCHSYTTRPKSPGTLPEVELSVVIFTFSAILCLSPCPGYSRNKWCTSTVYPLIKVRMVALFPRSVDLRKTLLLHCGHVPAEL